MAISIRPAIEADLPKIASVIMEAEAAHPIVALPWTDLKVAYQCFVERFTSAFSDPLNHILVAIDSNGDVAGYLVWREPGLARKFNPIFPEGTKTKVFEVWQAAQANKEEFRTADAAGMYNFVYFCTYFILEHHNELLADFFVRTSWFSNSPPLSRTGRREGSCQAVYRAGR